MKWQVIMALALPLVYAQAILDQRTDSGPLTGTPYSLAPPGIESASLTEQPIPIITHSEVLNGGSGLLIRWLSQFGQQFDLLRSNDLTDWVPVVSNHPASAQGESRFTFDLGGEQDQQFYKVELKPDRIEKPNVIMLFADDLGYGDLGCYGHPYARTPNLDRLASEGTLFRKFNVTGMTCNPSRTGILTSRHPNSFPLKTADYGFQGKVTIMELLKSAGYATGHFGKWHIGPDPVVNGTYGIDEIIISGGGGNDAFGRDQRVYEDAIAFIENHKDEPFYINVMGRVTHAPVNPRADLVVSAGFDELQIERSAFAGQQIKDNFDRVESVGGDIGESMANYLTEIYYLDYFVGQLLDKLDDLGLRDNTIVMFSSDQGAALVEVDDPEAPHKINLVGYSGGLRGQKHDQHEGGIRSPFILRWPGFIPAAKVNRDSIISALDWLPTLCRIAGVSIDSTEFHGEDVLDIWMGSDRSRKDPQFWNSSMKKDDWRIYFNGGNAIELYDLATDFDESENLVTSRPEIVAELTEIWQEWQATLP